MHAHLRDRASTPSNIDLDSLIDNASVRSDIDLDEEPLPRSSSAPPSVALSAGNIFAFTATDSTFVGHDWGSLDNELHDVRLDPFWNEFADSYPCQEKLPPSLQLDNTWFATDSLPTPLEPSHEITSSPARNSPTSDYTSSTYSTPAIPHVVPSLTNRTSHAIQPPISPSKSVIYPNTPAYPRSTANTICKYWERGNCRNGDRCSFLHSKGNASSVDIKGIKEPIIEANVIKIFDSTRLIEMASDQNGCRFLQRLLDVAREMYEAGDYTWYHDDVIDDIINQGMIDGTMDRSDLEELLEPFAIISQIFTDMLPHFLTLCEDPFGNYLCQKIIETVSQSCRLEICRLCASQLYAKAQQMHGTRSVQKMVEYATSQEERRIIISSLANHVIPLIKDLNGNHVIQKCLQFFNSFENQFIFDALLVPSNLVNVANSRNGACVLQRVLDYAPQSYRKALALVIVENTDSLVYDQFGNYALQYVFTLAGKNAYLHEIFEIAHSKIKGKISSLSKQKFASNVCETFLGTAPNHLTMKIVEEVFSDPHKVVDFLIDPFGNFVVQKSLACIPQHLLPRYLAIIQPHLSFLKTKTFGSKIAAKLVRTYPSLRD
ncbi:hypothetical protein P9112_003882 [Eukaryota sp. TZLM1-RC]